MLYRTVFLLISSGSSYFKVAGSNCKFTSSGIVDPAYVRPAFNWLRLITLGMGPYSGWRVACCLVGNAFLGKG